MNFFDSVCRFIRGDDFEDEEQVMASSEQETVAPKETKLNNTVETNGSVSVFNAKRDSSKIISINNNIQMQVVITYPKAIEDAATACDYIRQNKTCVINLEDADRVVAQRVADFLGGAAYAVNGDIQRVSADIFIIAPANVNITGELKEELKANGLVLPWVPVSSFKRMN